MDEQHQEVRQLLARAADAAGGFEAPPVEILTHRARRRSRTRPVLAAAVAAAVVFALAVGVSLTAAHHHSSTTTTTPTTTPLASSWPGPTGPAVPVSALRGYRWSSLSPAPIEERGDVASAWTGRLLIVWGGQSPAKQPHSAGANYKPHSDGATYDPKTRTWTTLPPAPLSARANALSAWVDGSFVVWGGVDGNGQQTNDGARYDVRTGTWTKLPAAPIFSYAWAQLVVAGNRAVLLSIPVPPEPGPSRIHANAYDPATDTWRPLPDLDAPHYQVTLDATALGVGDTVLVWADWLAGTYAGSYVGTYALDTKTDVWSPAPLQPDPGRNVSQPIWTGRRILLPDENLYCGTCLHPLSLDNPGVAIAPRTGARTLIPIGPLRSQSVDSFWTGSALLAVDADTGIRGSEGSTPGDTAAWDPDTNSWTELSSAMIDGDATGAAVVWTGSRLLVWGIHYSPGNADLTPAGLEFAPPGS